MIFNDYVDILNRQKNEIERLTNIKNNFKSILAGYDEWSKEMFSALYKRTIYSSMGNSAIKANELVNRTEQFSNTLREQLIGIDFVDLGEILANLNVLAKDEISDISNKIVIEFRNIYKRIHTYRKYTDKPHKIEEFSQCIRDIRNAIFYIDEFIFMVNSLNIINKGLNKGIEKEGLKIRLLNSSFDKETYSNVTEPVYKLYEKIAEIGNINIKEEKLQIVRMETGSFFIKFIGNTAILKTIAGIIESMHKIFIRNYTRDGQKQNLVESTELFKKQFDILQKMKENGLDVEEHEEIAKETLILLMKQSNILLSSSPDIKINDKVLSKSEDIKKELECNNIRYLSNNEDEIIG